MKKVVVILAVSVAIFMLISKIVEVNSNQRVIHDDVAAAVHSLKVDNGTKVKYLSTSKDSAVTENVKEIKYSDFND